MDKLKEFSETNGFNGYFRTSAKTGQNVSESMEFIIHLSYLNKPPICLFITLMAIKEIISKLEEMSLKGNEGMNERQSVALDPDKHNKGMDQKRKKEGCCS